MPKPIATFKWISWVSNVDNNWLEKGQNLFYSDIVGVDYKTDPWYAQAALAFDPNLSGDVDWEINHLIDVTDFLWKDTNAMSWNRIYYSTQNNDITIAWKTVVKWFSGYNATRTKMRTTAYWSDTRVPRKAEMVYFRNRLWPDANLETLTALYLYGSKNWALNLVNWATTATFTVGSGSNECPAVELIWDLQYQAVLDDWSTWVSAIVTNVSYVWAVWTLTFSAPYSWPTRSNAYFWLFKEDLANVYKSLDEFWFSTKIYRPKTVFQRKLYVWDWSHIYTMYYKPASWTWIFEWYSKAGWTTTYTLDLGSDFTIKQIEPWWDKLVILADKWVRDDWNDPDNWMRNESRIFVWNWVVWNSELTSVVDMTLNLRWHCYWLRAFNWTLQAWMAMKDAFWTYNDYWLFEFNWNSFEIIKKLPINTDWTWTTKCWVHHLHAEQWSFLAWIWGTCKNAWLYEIAKFDEDKWWHQRWVINENITWVFKFFEGWKDNVILTTTTWVRYLWTNRVNYGYLETQWLEPWYEWYSNNIKAKIHWTECLFKSNPEAWTWIECTYKIDQESNSFLPYKTFNASNNWVKLNWISRNVKKIKFKKKFLVDWTKTPLLELFRVF